MCKAEQEENSRAGGSFLNCMKDEDSLILKLHASVAGPFLAPFWKLQER